MNLIEIRRKLVELTGRNDLVDGDYEDNGIDFYISSGMRYIDSLIENMKGYGHYYKYILSGEWNIQIPYSKSIHAVWVSTKNSSKWRLEKKEFSWMLNNHLSDLSVNTVTGTPLYYTPIVTRTIMPKPPGLNAFMDNIVQTSNDYNAIMVLPIAGETIMIDIIGKFYSDALVKNTDSNFWSQVYPSTLIKAACREIEIYNQNKSKTDAWTVSINMDIEGINNMMIDEEIVDIDQMEG